MASPTRNSGLFKSLDTLPLFDSNGPVRRSHQRGLDWINSLPPLYLAVACLILFITTFGLVISLSSATGEADRLRQTLAEVEAALGVDEMAVANTTGTVADVQEEMAKQHARLEQLLAENAELQHANAILDGDKAQLTSRINEFETSQTACGDQLKALTDNIKLHIKTQMSEEQKSILSFINHEEDKLLEGPDDSISPTVEAEAGQAELPAEAPALEDDTDPAVEGQEVPEGTDASPAGDDVANNGGNGHEAGTGADVAGDETQDGSN